MVNKEVEPIEVKFGKIDTSGLLAFMRKFNINQGFVISYTREEELKSGKMSILVVPAFKFFLK